jgi:hypothetical protein
LSETYKRNLAHLSGFIASFFLLPSSFYAVGESKLPKLPKKEWTRRGLFDKLYKSAKKSLK